MKDTIYLDNHATTKLDPRVLEAMMPYLTDTYGNASSRSHSFGWKAEDAVEDAREQVAHLINANPSDIVFTSGATEANNIVLHDKNNIMLSSVEHSSVYDVCKKLLDNDMVVEEIKVDSEGRVNLQFLQFLLRSFQPDIISVMLANNEIGTIQPLKKIRELCPKVLIHSDMAQALGKIPIDVKELGVDFASFSAHKLYGPKGIGALYIKTGQDVNPLMTGGKQELGIRPGTLNVPAIVGFGKACEIAEQEMQEESKRIKRLRAIFFNEFVDRLAYLNWNGPEDNLPGNLNMPIPCEDMDAFLAQVSNKVAFSFGAACNTNMSSRTLESIGLSDLVIKRSIRLCFGRFNTEEEVIKAAQIMCTAIENINGG